MTKPPWTSWILNDLQTLHIHTTNKLEVWTQNIIFFLSLVATSLHSRTFWGKWRFVKQILKSGTKSGTKSWEITGLYYLTKRLSPSTTLTTDPSFRPSMHFNSAKLSSTLPSSCREKQVRWQVSSLSINTWWISCTISWGLTWQGARNSQKTYIMQSTGCPQPGADPVSQSKRDHMGKSRGVIWLSIKSWKKLPEFTNRLTETFNVGLTG